MTTIRRDRGGGTGRAAGAGAAGGGARTSIGSWPSTWSTVPMVDAEGRAPPPGRAGRRRRRAASAGPTPSCTSPSPTTTASRRRGPAGDGTEALLAAASAAGVRHVVGAVVGAGVRRVAEQPAAAHRGRAPAPERRVALTPSSGPGCELLLATWAAAEPERVAGVLRPCTALAPGRVELRWPGRWRRPPAPARSRRSRPRQFVHLDDLAAAVDVVRRARLDGPCNVAPDGWIPGDIVRDLSGVAPRPGHAGDAWPRLLARIRWRFQRGPDPAGPAAVHRLPVAGGQRPAEGRRLGAALHQRAGLRRRHRGAVVDHAQPQAQAGAGLGHRRRGGGGARRGVGRSSCAASCGGPRRS